MKFLVLGRRDIKYRYAAEKHIVVSIHDPKSPKIQMFATKNRLDTLRLSFHDWDGEQLRIMYEREERPEMVFFSVEMAKQILKFVDKYSDKVDLIVCQCEAGISRSAGIAAALSKIFNKDDEYFFKHYIPNSLVYSQIIRAWSRDAYIPRKERIVFT